jgi:hypothetical protein
MQNWAGSGSRTSFYAAPKVHAHAGVDVVGALAMSEGVLGLGVHFVFNSYSQGRTHGVVLC